MGAQPYLLEGCGWGRGVPGGSGRSRPPQPAGKAGGVAAHPGALPSGPRHADGIFNKAYRKLLGQLSARKYLHSLMAKRVG